MSRILVVEDETHIAEGLRFNLKAEGHDVEVNADGEGALTRLLARGEIFDLVVPDAIFFLENESGNFRHKALDGRLIQHLVFRTIG